MLDTEVAYPNNWGDEPCYQTHHAPEPENPKYVKHLHGGLVEYLLPLLQATAIDMRA